MVALTGQELRLDAYPNCGKKLSETSTWSYISPTDHTVAGGGWFAWGCTDVIPGTLRSELEKIFPPVDAYLDFYVFDAANYQKFINGQASSCLCNELCFLQGTNGNMLPDPKIGRCELAQTTTVYHVMVNRGANAAVYYQFGSYFHYDGFLDSSSSSSSSSSSTSILSSSSLTSSSSTAQGNHFY